MTGDPHTANLSEEGLRIVGPEGIERRPLVLDHARFVAIEFFDFLFQLPGEQAHFYSHRTCPFARSAVGAAPGHMECPKEMKGEGVCRVGGLSKPLRLGFINETCGTVACRAGVAARVTANAGPDQFVEIEPLLLRQHGFDFADLLVAVDLLFLYGFPQQFVIEDRVFVRADGAVFLEKIQRARSSARNHGPIPAPCRRSLRPEGPACR